MNDLDPSDAMMIMGVHNEIRGALRFMLCLFLADKDGAFGKDLRGVCWEPSFYGPHWGGFDATVESLERQGLLTVETLHSRLGNTTQKFSVTPKGILRFQDLTKSNMVDSPKRWPALSWLCACFQSSQESDLEYLLREHQQNPLSSLLDFVYEQYPEYGYANVADSRTGSAS